MSSASGARRRGCGSRSRRRAPGPPPLPPSSAAPGGLSCASYTTSLPMLGVSTPPISAAPAVRVANDITGAPASSPPRPRPWRGPRIPSRSSTQAIPTHRGRACRWPQTKSSSRPPSDRHVVWSRWRREPRGWRPVAAGKTAIRRAVGRCDAPLASRHGCQRYSTSGALLVARAVAEVTTAKRATRISAGRAREPERVELEAPAAAPSRAPPGGCRSPAVRRRSTERCRSPFVADHHRDHPAPDLGDPPLPSGTTSSARPHGTLRRCCERNSYVSLIAARNSRHGRASGRDGTPDPGPRRRSCRLVSHRRSADAAASSRIHVAPARRAS